ncbi:MAG: carbamoyltransferase HypF [Deltaproteobacteria bacterium]|nr:carbamoyltransferase HypF [Deltaproteobacteria bacterium]
MGRVAVKTDQEIGNKGVATRIKGIVQGVGFRPFIYNLALANNVKGFVSNTSQGVYIEAEGVRESLDAFLSAIPEEKPPLALIVSIETAEQPTKKYSDFTIQKSESQEQRRTLISPDVCVCGDCLTELFDPNDRRYGYPFINCTNCGPRYTIIKDIPYDRPFTAMKQFKMCPACQTEYDDPGNRRFHAQPNACWDCGPIVRMWDREKQEVYADDPIGHARALLKEGKIVAVKGLGGFHLAVDATNNEAVKRLRERKHREEKPLAVMVAKLEHIKQFARVSEGEKQLLNSIQRPIVLLEKLANDKIAEEVSPRNRNYGVMLAYTPLHYLLLQGDELSALVMTSANISEEPIAIDNGEAFEHLRNIADYFLNHNRDIYLRSDDSITRVVDEIPRQIRRSRGYVPIPTFVKDALEPILACGAEWKNTICLTRGDQAFLSQHIGDLENLETLNFFEMTVNHLKRILEIEPEIIAYDLHPDYLSTQYALKQTSMVRIGIQHHHAHVVSAMAENGLTGPVIGIALDGTGYGTDGHIWGGEVMVVEPHRFERYGHFAYVPMPGGAAAIKKPWRMAVSSLYDAFGEAFIEMNLPFLKSIPKERLKILIAMIEKGVNTPLTSSCGRLFDSVAALTGVRNYVAYEGQAAVELEAMADGDMERVYPFEIRKTSDVEQFLTEPIIRAVAEDVREGCSQGLISATFHNTLVALFLEVCQRARTTHGLSQVVLSGGCFQNARLLVQLTRALETDGFEVYGQAAVPCNDGGIALGQAVAADAMYKNGLYE